MKNMNHNLKLLASTLFLLFFVSNLLNAQVKSSNNNSASLKQLPLSISGTKTVYSMVTAGINTIDGKSNSVSVYPNPFSDAARFELGSMDFGRYCDILIYNTSGTLVKKVSNITSSFFDLSRENLEPQMYYYRVLFSDSKKETLGRFVIVN